MKICSKCKIEKPFEAFWRSKDKVDGYLPSCIECKKLRKLELKKNPLMQLEKEIRSSVILENKLLKRENKKLCSRCKEVFLIDDLLSDQICKECSIEKSKEYREKNKEKVREYMEEYYEKNKEKRKEYSKEHREKNKEKIANKKNEYYLKNIEKKKEYDRQYRLKKKLEKQNNI